MANSAPLDAAGAKPVFAWCLYDWANSAFPTVIITFVFAAYFIKGVAIDEVVGTAQWGTAIALSAVAVAVVSPVLGAIADRGGRRILFEGAQGGLLDVDLGTYPFATSSNTTTGGVLTGLGINLKMIDEVLGVVKAYCSRVGAGPFPTELVNETGEKFRHHGDEYGSSTGRPRRCGWLDLVALRYTCRINGVDSIAVTKIDVLDNFESIEVCTGYELNGKTLSEVPLDLADLTHVVPVYQTLPGWSEETTGITKFDDLPARAKDYLKFVADDLKVKISLVSTGAKRNETIFV